MPIRLIPGLIKTWRKHIGRELLGFGFICFRSKALFLTELYFGCSKKIWREQVCSERKLLLLNMLSILGQFFANHFIIAKKAAFPRIGR